MRRRFQVVFCFFVILLVDGAFRQQQMARQLRFFGQFFNVVQVLVARFGIAALVGRVCRQHQCQNAFVARFFVGQHFIGLRLGFLEFAFKIGQAGRVERLGGFAVASAHAEAAQLVRRAQNAGNQAHQYIQRHHGSHQTQHEQVQVHANHGVFDDQIHIACVGACGNGYTDGQRE